MGLDMYLNGKKSFWTNWQSQSPQDNRIEDGFKITDVILEIGYWRKHPNLHGYIVNTFADGNDDCKPIRLEAGDIKNIIEAVKGRKLPHTDGFFFGASDGSHREVDDDLKKLNAALSWLTAKDDNPNAIRSIYYEASW